MTVIYSIIIIHKITESIMILGFSLTMVNRDIEFRILISFVFFCHIGAKSWQVICMWLRKSEDLPNPKSLATFSHAPLIVITQWIANTTHVAAVLVFLVWYVLYCGMILFTGDRVWQLGSQHRCYRCECRLVQITRHTTIGAPGWRRRREDQQVKDWQVS